MSSILKRISPISKLNRKLIKNQSKITFSLDEPEFVLNSKFESNTFEKKSNTHVTNSKACSQCDDSGFDINISTCTQHVNKLN